MARATLIVPTLCVGTHPVTQSVTTWTQSVLGGIPTQSVGTSGPAQRTALTPSNVENEVSLAVSKKLRM